MLVTLSSCVYACDIFCLCASDEQPQEDAYTCRLQALYGSSVNRPAALIHLHVYCQHRTLVSQITISVSVFFAENKSLWCDPVAEEGTPLHHSLLFQKKLVTELS